MTIHSFHLATANPFTTVRALVRRPTAPGLQHAEVMTRMRLGAPVISPSRLQLRHPVMFAAWDDEDALDRFLIDTPLGRTLGAGWHVRLQFLRRWGHISEFDLPEHEVEHDIDEPVVAVTLARMRLPQVPRFLQWGRPVERLVRDDPNKTLAMAAFRAPRTVSTFSIWRSATDMVAMVRGTSDVAQPRRHIDAMGERSRKDFHFEFTTLRFRALSEHGAWEGTSQLVPSRSPE